MTITLTPISEINIEKAVDGGNVMSMKIAAGTEQ